jgi:hypothetical protein
MGTNNSPVGPIDPATTASNPTFVCIRRRRLARQFRGRFVYLVDSIFTFMQLQPHRIRTEAISQNQISAGT